MTDHVTFVIPGDIATRTGGYEYDRRLIAALRSRGWVVGVSQIEDGFPRPGHAIRQQLAMELSAQDDGAIVVIDGLALGVLPDQVLAESTRLRLVALIHHPLALETGLSQDTAAELLASERRALAAVRHIVVTSRATVERLAAYDVRLGDVSVVVPGTEPAPLTSRSGGQPGQPVRLLCVASVVPRKGHTLLIQALRRLRAYAWHLTCGGSLERDAATAAALVRQIAEAGLDQQIALVGELSETQLAAAYAQADVFVLPTLYEGYGMVVAEAIARGLPVVASDTGGISELLAGEAGIVVPPGDVDALTSALMQVISDPATRATLTEGACRRRVSLPSWSDAGAAMEAVLLQVAHT